MYNGGISVVNRQIVIMLLIFALSLTDVNINGLCHFYNPIASKMGMAGKINNPQMLK